jgi:hypothetical protein
MELFYLENDLPGSAKARKPAFSPPFISLNARAGILFHHPSCRFIFAARRSPHNILMGEVASSWLAARWRDAQRVRICWDKSLHYFSKFNVILLQHLRTKCWGQIT